MQKRAQNTYAESRWSLIATTVFAALVYAAYAYAGASGMGLSVMTLVVSTLLMIMLNDRNALLRISSRMVSCFFLIMTSAASFLLTSWQGGVASVMLIACLLSIFSTYQDRHAQGRLFYAFAFIGIASVFFPQIVLFVPALWLAMYAMQSARLSTLAASLLGLVAPYWFLVAYCFLTGRQGELLPHFSSMVDVGHVLDYKSLTWEKIATVAYVMLLSVVGIVHFLRTSYKDSLHVRHLYETIIFLDVAVMLALVLLPRLFDELLRMLIIFTSPLIAHFVALTNTRWTNVAFFVIMLASLAVTLINLQWML